MSSSFTFLNALPIIMVATKKTSKPWEPSPYYFVLRVRPGFFLSFQVHISLSEQTGSTHRRGPLARASTNTGNEHTL